MTPRRPLVTALVGGFLLVLASAAAQTPNGKLILLNVSKDQLPADTGSDQTKPEIVADVAELGGKALKVVFIAGDSFGSRLGNPVNWKPFRLFRFDAVNPSKAPAGLELTLVHARSTNYQTRVVVPIRLKPGKNEVKIALDEMMNVNGSAPDLARVLRWYVHDADNKAPTLYFGDIFLEGADSAARPEPGTSAPGGSALGSANIGYRVKGKVGSLDVDLTLTPFALASAGGGSGGAAAPAAPGGAAVAGDPARLTRIRAAKMPRIEKPIDFYTPEADTICSALEVFPPDNPWNLVVEDWPLHANSKRIIGSIGPNKPFRYNPDMGFILVPPDQPKVALKNVEYASESDKGPFPIPANIPIEGWPGHYLQQPGKKLTLDSVQRDALKQGGDRHAIVVDPTNRMLYEFFGMKKTNAGWEASQASVFDLKSNKLRPDGWTSADAAGLPIFPAAVRYDELKRGIIEHAMRVTVVKTKREYVYPATHYASRLTSDDLPRMGERIRLRRDFDVAGFSPEVTTILKGLKKYGMLVADNGIDWAISVTPDPRIPVLHEELRKIKGSDFEVVVPPPGYKPAVE